MKNTKRTLIISSLVMLLSLIVVIISVTAAWFGDTRNVSNKITISSEKEVIGNATIDIESASPEREDGRLLTPAVIKAGLLMGDYTGVYNNINVLDTSLVDSTNSDASKPLLSVANTVTVYFPFIYNGGPDTAVGGDRKKSIEIALSSATLANPRKTNADGSITIDDTLLNYSGEFCAEMTIVSRSVDEDGKETYTRLPPTPVADLPDSANTAMYWEKNDDVIYMVLTPGITYYCEVMIYFAKVDEECAPALIDTTVWFNFDIAAVRRK